MLVKLSIYFQFFIFFPYFIMSFKIYTKSGDKGDTSLFGGKRLPKDHLRIEAYGTIDELNACLGLVRDGIQENEVLRSYLKDIQDTLFTIGSNLAMDPEKPSPYIKMIEQSVIIALENEIDAMDAVLPPLKNFILPGGHTTVSFCHLARTVCRRAERNTVALSHSEIVSPLIIEYLNRLSDYLFMLSRKIAQDLKVAEVLWTNK
jgi:cob(I)alamin adenosyltransferase